MKSVGALACLGNPDPVGMKVFALAGENFRWHQEEGKEENRSGSSGIIVAARWMQACRPSGPATTGRKNVPT
jgi:hypothetical protein